jgi:hypothetical protein
MSSISNFPTPPEDYLLDVGATLPHVGYESRLPFPLPPPLSPFLVLFPLLFLFSLLSLISIHHLKLLREWHIFRKSF